MSEVLKPLIKWAGGKSELSVRVQKAFHGQPARRYIEPFVGAGGSFLSRVKHSEEVVYDTLDEVIALHMAVRDEPDSLFDALRYLPYINTVAVYKEQLALFNTEPNKYKIESVARLIWLNKAGFNGLFRTNAKGLLNVPVGDRWPPGHRPTPSRSEVHTVSERLQGVEIVHGDFRLALALAGEGDQVYCDPPYADPDGRAPSFKGYAKGSFSKKDQWDLAKMAKGAVARGAEVVVSNFNCSMIQSFYKGGDFDVFPHPGSMTQGRSKLEPVEEVLIRVA